MTNIYLIRHGETAMPNALNGKTDVPLSAKGWQQLTLSAASLPKISSIVSSPLNRCAEFAQKFALERGLTLNTNNDLAEMDFGEWDGVPFDQLKSQWSELESFWHAPGKITPPNGESLAVFANRIVTCWQNLCRGSLSQDTAIFCHGGTIRIILAHTLGLDFNNPLWFQNLHIRHASISALELSTYGTFVKTIGYRPLTDDSRTYD